MNEDKDLKKTIDNSTENSPYVSPLPAKTIEIGDNLQVSKQNSDITPTLGRPTKYQGEATDKLAYRLALLGLIDSEIATELEIDEATLNRWKNTHESFCESLALGKTKANADVAASLYDRAVGYTHDDEEIKVIANEVVRVKTKKHYPPDVAAAKIFLFNRDPKRWKDRREIETTNLNIFSVSIEHNKSTNLVGIDPFQQAIDVSTESED